MTFEKIAELIADQLGIDKDSITEDSRLLEDLKADSLDTVEMLMTVEDEFGIQIPDEDAVNLNTIKSIVDYIDARK